MGIPKIRITWIDALKTFLAISVVFFHSSGAFLHPVPEWLNEIRFLNHNFNVPGFAFISGYIAFRASADVSWHKTIRNIFVRWKAYVVPSVVFLILFGGYEAMQKLAFGMFGNYYFLGALVNIFIIYFLLRWACRGNDKRFLIVLSVVTVVMAVVLTLYSKISAPSYFEWRDTCNLMYFFTLGVLVKAFRHKLRPYVDHWYVLAGVAAIFFVLVCLSPSLPKGALRIVNSTFGVATVSLAFYVGRHLFDHNRIKPLANYCGQRTLSLYIFHMPVLCFLRDAGLTFSGWFLLPCIILMMSASYLFHDLIYKVPMLHAIIFGQKRIV